MKHLLGILLLTGMSPALAQHDHHPAPPAPADSHARHEGSEESGHPADHALPAEPPASPPADPHAGHDRSIAPDGAGSAAHAGHEPTVADPPVSPPSPAALGGPSHAADGIFGAKEMAEARRIVRKEHGDIRVGAILIDRLEAIIRDGKDGYAWHAQGWYGGDIDRLWIKSQGEGRFGDAVEEAEVQALWSHALDPWWNLQAGIRQDIRAGTDRTYAVLGVQGLAPYWFEAGGALFLSDKGDVTARFEVDYDQRLTQKLILQPAMEVNLAAQEIPELGIGAGLSTAEVGLRLRYAFVPEVAPYVGVQYERAFGDTADVRRARGEAAGGWGLLIGIRAWF
ncbi:MAG TPA: copper resistance protein B [Sphingobium sp.]|nr:copper resistance protein B [Sphingobium sp.]